MKHPLGELASAPVGTHFSDRKMLAQAGVHRERMRGISWSTKGPAESVVISGGYEDDEDWGNTILYTGMGGNESGVQVADQELVMGNRALVCSLERRTPVRVIRGDKSKSPFAPREGLRYDGLFRVTDAFYERGRSGFRVWRFLLTSMDSLEPPQEVTDAQLGLIELYQSRCQLCGRTTTLRTGPTATAFHIRPVSRPHFGSDEWPNLLCVCPNHATELDSGSLMLQPDLQVLGWGRELRVHPRHVLDTAAILYRAERYSFALER